MHSVHKVGGTIPAGDFAPIGGEIGANIARTIGLGPAILIRNQGVIAIEKNPAATAKAAVMAEDAARTVFYSMKLGKPIPIPDEMSADCIIAV